MQLCCCVWGPSRPRALKPHLTLVSQLNGGSVCSSRSDLPGLDKDTEVAGAPPPPLLWSLPGGPGALGPGVPGAVRLGGEATTAGKPS